MRPTLIQNDAVTNSVKHAFGDRGERIMVRVSKAILGEARLTVADNGCGIGSPRPGGSGMKLIESLARRIGGTLNVESSETGTVTTVIFPMAG